MRNRFLSIASAAIIVVIAAARAADPVTYSIAIDDTGASDLNDALNAASLLVSLREKAPAGSFALVTRAREDAERLVTTLHSFGYYQAKVTITIAGRGLDDTGLLQALDAVPDGQTVAVRAAIDKGPVYLLRYLEVDGTGDDNSEAELGLVTDRPAIASNILAASSRLLAALQEKGYALAKVDPPIAYADDTTHTIDVLVKVQPGARVKIGTITITGLKHVHEGVVRDSLTVLPGDPYRPSRIELARQSALNLGVFAGVGVHAADKLDADGRIPLTFEATERPMHAVAFTAAYSTDLGASLSASWSHRNLFGNAEQLNLSAAATGLGGSDTNALGYTITAQFIKPNYLARNQTLEIDLGGIKQSLDAYDQTAESAAVYLRRKFSDLWSGSAGVSAINDQVAQEGTSRAYQLIGLPIAATYDSTATRGLLEDPVRGARGALSLTPTLALNHGAPFVTAQASGSIYFDTSDWFGEKPGRTIIASRALIASIVGAQQLDLPPDQRLYVGGSGTVRGYKYQSIGPLFADGKPVGATSADSASVELRKRIGEDFGFAVFADAGQASETRVPFNGPLEVGVGAGVRYYTSIGPLRADIAIPLSKPQGGDSFEIYIGLGQAF